MIVRNYLIEKRPTKSFLEEIKPDCVSEIGVAAYELITARNLESALEKAYKKYEKALGCSREDLEKRYYICGKEATEEEKAFYELLAQ